MSYYFKKYEWTAFTESDLLGNGRNGSDFGKGDSFVMGSATTKMATWDNDGSMAGDSGRDGYSGDRSGQDGYVNGVQTGCKMYAEQYHTLKGSDGKTYYLIEIKIEGHDSAGAGNGYFTFYGAQPPAGTWMTVTGTCNVSGCWIDYSCIGAGRIAPPNTAPTFTNVPSDGVFCVNENSKLVVDLNAADQDCDSLGFSIVGGADGAAFAIDAKTGVLSFKTAPDFEKPADADGNNSYKVIVAVSDGKGGVSNKELTVNVKDLAETAPKCLVIEAEDMKLSCYTVKCATSASGGEYIALTGNGGSASTTFGGAAGEYDLSLRYWDTSGDGNIKVYVNGKLVDTVRLNANDGAWHEITLEDLGLKKGDVITLRGEGRGCESAIIDKVKICPSEPEPKPGALEGRVFHDADKNGVDGNEAGVSGVAVQLLNAAGVVVATTVTGANGGYAFANLQPGDYSVVFPTSVNGRPLTGQDVGGDDAIDSDASTATGKTGHYTVEAGETVTDVDAGVIDPNKGPDAADDAAGLCAGDEKTVDVLANDKDADGDGLTITKVDGQAIADGQSITTADGMVVSLVAGKLVFDSAHSDHADLLIGQKASATYSYEISDGNGGTDTATVDLDFCGSVNTLETIKASLPASGTLMLNGDLSFGGSYYTAAISGTGDDRFDGKSFDIAYCVSAYEPINLNEDVPFAMYLATGDSVPTGIIANPENLDMVNWILNQDFGAMDNGDGTGQTYTEDEIQGAIWGLTDDIVFVDPAGGTTANAQEIYDLAMAHGEGFTLSEGDIIGLILDPTADAEAAGNKQPFIIGVDWDDLAQDCLCY